MEITERLVKKSSKLEIKLELGLDGKFAVRPPDQGDYALDNYMDVIQDYLAEY